MPSTGFVASTALAFVSFSFGAYLELERKVRCPGPACSSPRMPVISRFAASSGRQSSEQPSAAANSLIFMVKHKGTPGAEYACGAWLQPVPEKKMRNGGRFLVKRFGCSGL